MNIPEWYKEKLIEEFGEELTNEIIFGYQEERVTTYRENKSNFKIYIADKDVINSPEFENGEIYVQSLSSMIPPIVLEPKERQDILDMTAAPGGKTTELACLTNNKANITACEMNAIRFERLKYNVEKQKATSVYCLKKDARELDNFMKFDKILLDAPCSGSGIIDKNTDFEKGFTQELINKCKNTQYKLLKKALKLVKAGGEIVYSTCSILKEEDEDIVLKAIENENVEIVPIQIDLGVGDMKLLPTSIEGTIKIMPNKYYEGFYICKISKKR